MVTILLCIFSNRKIRKAFRILCLCAICAGGPTDSTAQKVDAFARISLNKRSVYAQQPVKATITVYTATWFTQPLSFDNIQIPNAFIIPFTRTIPGIFHINGKQYAGLEFYYLIYPYKSGAYQLPVINIVAETPPEGGYQGVKITVKTQPLKYTVKEIPATFTGESWFVAKGATLRDYWNKSLSTVKVGDVLERTIQINARGALPNFIPVIKPPPPKGTSIYQNDPQLVDQRDDYDVNGTRIEKITYLFEKEGEITIPGIKLQWWNPLRQRIETKQTKDVTINVHPNENLGILATVRDSLNAQQSIPGGEKTKQPFLILGMTWQKFLVTTTACFFALWMLTRLTRSSLRLIRMKRKTYRASEKYWFHRFMRADNQPTDLIAKFYAWWDRLPSQPPSVKNSAVTDDIQRDWLKIETAWIGQKQITNEATDFKKQMAGLRKTVRKKTTHLMQTDDRQTRWPG